MQTSELDLLTVLDCLQLALGGSRVRRDNFVAESAVPRTCSMKSSVVSDANVPGSSLLILLKFSFIL
jgi:hypothetical protein